MTRDLLIFIATLQITLSTGCSTAPRPQIRPRVIYTIDNVPDTADICVRPNQPARFPACMPAEAVKRMIRGRVIAHMEMQPTGLHE